MCKLNLQQLLFMLVSRAGSNGISQKELLEQVEKEVKKILRKMVNCNDFVLTLDFKVKLNPKYEIPF